MLLDRRVPHIAGATHGFGSPARPGTILHCFCNPSTGIPASPKELTWGEGADALPDHQDHKLLWAHHIP